MTENGQFCCEVCPDEIHKAAGNADRIPPPGLPVITRSLSDEEKSAGLLKSHDDYSDLFETALEYPEDPALTKNFTLSSGKSEFTRARSQFVESQLGSSSSEDEEPPDLPKSRHPSDLPKADPRDLGSESWAEDRKCRDFTDVPNALPTTESQEVARVKSFVGARENDPKSKAVSRGDHQRSKGVPTSEDPRPKGIPTSDVPRSKDAPTGEDDSKQAPTTSLVKMRMQVFERSKGQKSLDSPGTLSHQKSNSEANHQEAKFRKSSSLDMLDSKSAQTPGISPRGETISYETSFVPVFTKDASETSKGEFQESNGSDPSKNSVKFDELSTNVNSVNSSEEGENLESVTKDDGGRTTPSIEVVDVSDELSISHADRSSSSTKVPEAEVPLKSEESPIVISDSSSELLWNEESLNEKSHVSISSEEGSNEGKLDEVGLDKRDDEERGDKENAEKQRDEKEEEGEDEQLLEEDKEQIHTIKEQIHTIEEDIHSNKEQIHTNKEEIHAREENFSSEEKDKFSGEESHLDNKTQEIITQENDIQEKYHSKKGQEEDYPEDLNPFSDDENEEVPPQNKSLNPFDEDEDEDGEEPPEAPKPTLRKKIQVPVDHLKLFDLDEGTPDHLKKVSSSRLTLNPNGGIPDVTKVPVESEPVVVAAPRISLNPFWSDGEEPGEDQDEETVKPVPLPRSSK